MIISVAGKEHNVAASQHEGSWLDPLFGLLSMCYSLSYVLLTSTWVSSRFSSKQSSRWFGFSKLPLNVNACDTERVPLQSEPMKHVGGLPAH